MKKTIQIGIITLSVDTDQRKDQKFCDAFDAGLQCYAECDSYQERQMTVNQLIKMMNGIVSNDDRFGGKLSVPWVYGFILGWVTGLNNPEIINDDPDLSYTESIMRKHTPLYRDLVLQHPAEPTATEQERMTSTEPFPLSVLQEV